MIELVIDIKIRDIKKRNKFKEYNKLVKNLNEILLYKPKIILLPDDNKIENKILKAKLIEKYN